MSSDPLDRLPWTTEVPTEPGIYLAREPGGGMSTVFVEQWGNWSAAPGISNLEWCRVPERSEELECCGSPIGCEALHAGMCPDERPRG